MDASRFDAWTRRRFGLIAGGSIASLAGLSAIADSEAKKKKKKKKCKKLKNGCKTSGKKKRCCKGLTCGESVAIPEGTHCCRKAQGACTDATECCAPSLCNVGEGRCCILNGEGPCTADADCCDAGNVCNDENLCVIPL
jgi:hypothetical protein